MRPNRRAEIRRLLQLTPRQVIDRAGSRLVVCESVEDLYRHLAESIFDEIRANCESGLPTRLILPVGPTGHYPLLTKMLLDSRLSLANCHFFFMDEAAAPTPSN